MALLAQRVMISPSGLTRVVDGLVKQGLRAWGRDWMRGLAHHGLMFVAGSMLILLLQKLLGGFWVVGLALPLLGLFVGSTWLACSQRKNDLSEVTRRA